MNQKDIIIEVLKKLGGRGTVEDICVLGKHYIGDSSVAQSVEANIRRILNSNPDLFRHPEGVDKGEWELVSYQEKIAEKDRIIADLKSQLAAKNEELKMIKTEDSFVYRLVKSTKALFGINRKQADFVRQVLLKVGRIKEHEELLDWIQGKEKKKPRKVPTKKIIQKISNSQVFNGAITESEFKGGGMCNE